MVEEPSRAGPMAERIRVAFDSADVTAIGGLLDPNVRWGAPDDPVPSCQNRDQVLAWYQRGRDAGVRAQVTEILAHGDKVLVGLNVVGRPGVEGPDGEANRWQVLTVRGGLIVDIRGFEERRKAAARVSL
jgi:ketosteroid isomerase-like protein